MRQREKRRNACRNGPQSFGLTNQTTVQNFCDPFLMAEMYVALSLSIYISLYLSLSLPLSFVLAIARSNAKTVALSHGCTAFEQSHSSNAVE